MIFNYSLFLLLLLLPIGISGDSHVNNAGEYMVVVIETEAGARE